MPAAGGTFDIRIETGDGCSWRAHHQSDFISPHSNDANAGSGEVTYAAQPNGGLARAGVASIAGETFAVRQAGEEALIPVCQRTREVRDAIVMELTGKACEALTEQDLQHVSSLSFRGRRLTSLRPDDFQGLVNLSRLDLSGAITDIAPLAGLVGFTPIEGASPSRQRRSEPFAFGELDANRDFGPEPQRHCGPCAPRRLKEAADLFGKGQRD